MKKYFVFSALILSFLSFQLGAAVSYQKGMHTIEFNGKCSDNRPRSKDIHMTAIENAKKAAWNNYTAKFSAEKTEKYKGVLVLCLANKKLENIFIIEKAGKPIAK